MTRMFSLHAAAYWGLASIASALSFWILSAFFFHPGFPVTLWSILFDLEVFLFTVTFVMHLTGYLTLAKKTNSQLLFWSTLVIMLMLALLGFLIIIAKYSAASAENSQLIDGLIGMDIVGFYLTAVVYAYALFKIIRFATLPVALFLFSAISLWSPWLTMLLFIPSTYYLFIRSAK